MHWIPGSLVQPRSERDTSVAKFSQKGPAWAGGWCRTCIRATLPTVSADAAMTWLTVGGSVAAGLVVLLLMESARRALACLIGVTGVLMQAQVHGVHAF